MQRSKTYRAAAETFDKNELYAPLAAIKIAKNSSKKKLSKSHNYQHKQSYLITSPLK